MAAGVIGASLSKPHSDEFAMDEFAMKFVCIYINIYRHTQQK